MDGGFAAMGAGEHQYLHTRSAQEETATRL